MNGIDGYQINGEASGDLSGPAVALVGDVNGDGFDDLIIGAYRANPNGAYSGSSYLVFGKPGGLGATLDLWALNGSNGVQINGVVTGDRSGHSVAAAGDLNLDGSDGRVVGADHVGVNGIVSGTSCIIFGKATCGTAGNDILGTSGTANVRSGLGGNNTIRGNAGADTLNGGTGNDQIFGGSEIDTLVGGTGNDQLDGGTGIDSHFGGSGNDTFAIDSLSAAIPNASGTYIVRSGTFSLTLTNAALSAIENPRLTGSGSFNLTGTAMVNVLTGNVGNNVLNGGGRTGTLIAVQATTPASPMAAIQTPKGPGSGA